MKSLKYFLLFVGTCLLVSCASEKEDFAAPSTPTQDKVAEIPAADRSKVLPNELFVAVWNQSLEQVSAAIKTDRGLLKGENADGNTALGLALSLGYRTITQRLLQETPASDLGHLNHKSESYFFLASRAGFQEAITWMADSYYSSLGFLQNYEISDLDVPNSEGQTAIFVAANRQVVEALQAQYYRGLLEMPFWGFTMHTDLQNQTFLHTAARDGRVDVINWAADRICAPGYLEKDSYWLVGDVVKVLTTGMRASQTFGPDQGSPLDLLFNRANNDGQTALHVAVSHRRWDSARALAHCRWLDFDWPDGQGDLPLQTFLKSLNPFLAIHDQETRDTFDFLTSQVTEVRKLTWGPVNRVNYVNNEGNTALHLAASLADPYFFNQLSRLGDIYSTNRAGETAENIFINRQRQVKNYGR